ncbi:SDR family oxidoreductase [Aquabacterium sp.]|uniref:SDR family oxidoreductase n=1 Tax=Aquabacterium sp. TaxID=1872578 RepID=UPI0025BA9E75|nr:SDR family oxidoreductase [Aquabacterium sp.]
MKTTGNTILVTGGTSGIGRALAERWHATGNRVIVVGRRAELIAELTAAHPGMSGYALDMADAAAVADFGVRVVHDHPDLNVVVHNAGIMEAENLAGDDWLAVAERTVSTNLLAPIRLTAALLPHLRRVSDAAIVTVSSGLAFVPLTKTPTYCATKAAIHSWSLSLRRELGRSGIEVIELAPPAVQTDLMPGHKANPNILPLPVFIDEALSQFAQMPTPAEILVERVMFQRAAEREGRFQSAFDTINSRG